MTAEAAAASAAREQLAHEDTVAGNAIDGYASWVCAGHSKAPPLRILETTSHTGTRIWEAAWLHRKWALEQPQLFNGARVLECGAGCGLLGLSIAAAHPTASVTLSDFAGHFESGAPASSVLHNLAANADCNAALLGGRVRVVNLDWSRPEAAELFWPPSGDASPAICEPVDVLVATECIYSEAGAALLAAVLARYLRPGGVASLLNNAKRTGVSRFGDVCTAAGLVVAVLPVPPRPADVMPTFTSWSNDEYVMWEVRWAER